MHLVSKVMCVDCQTYKNNSYLVCKLKILICLHAFLYKMNENINFKLLQESADESTMFEKVDNVTTADNVRVEIEDNSLLYILVPLAVLFGVFLLAALVLLMARNRRRLIRMCKTRQELATHFSYLDDESDISLLDNVDIDIDPTECLLQGKLHINNDHPSTNMANRVRFV